MYFLIICLELKRKISLRLVTGPACPIGHIGGRPRPVSRSVNVDYNFQQPFASLILLTKCITVFPKILCEDNDLERLMMLICLEQ